MLYISAIVRYLDVFSRWWHFPYCNNLCFCLFYVCTGMGIVKILLKLLLLLILFVDRVLSLWWSFLRKKKNCPNWESKLFYLLDMQLLIIINYTGMLIDSHSGYISPMNSWLNEQLTVTNSMWGLLSERYKPGSDADERAVLGRSNIGHPSVWI